MKRTGWILLVFAVGCSTPAPADDPGEEANAAAAASEPAQADPLKQGDDALAKKDYDRALACFTAAIKADAKNAKAYIGRGKAHTEKGKFAEAIADFTEAMRLEPKNAEAYQRRGEARRKRILNTDR